MVISGIDRTESINALKTVETFLNLHFFLRLINKLIMIYYNDPPIIACESLSIASICKFLNNLFLIKKSIHVTWTVLINSKLFKTIDPFFKKSSITNCNTWSLIYSKVIKNLYCIMLSHCSIILGQGELQRLWSAYPPRID